MSFRTWAKVVSAGLAVCIGGPALVYYVSPTEEELFLRYNPELQKRSLANRRQTQQDFDSFITKLREYSKSDRPIWEAAAMDEAKTRAATEAKARASASQQLQRQAQQPLQQPVPPLRPENPPDPEAMRRQLREEALRGK